MDENHYNSEPQLQNSFKRMQNLQNIGLVALQLSYLLNKSTIHSVKS